MNKLWTNLKSWYGVLFLVLLAGGVLWFVLNGMPFISNLRANWEAQRLQAQWEKPYREDTYGGKTPEETYDMFLDALRKGDTTLASKYFVVGDQAKWQKTLDEYKNNNLLSNFVKELENNRKIWTKLPPSGDLLFKDTESYGYSVVIKNGTTANIDGQKVNIPAGTYDNETEFQLNTYTKIWKIVIL